MRHLFLLFSFLLAPLAPLHSAQDPPDAAFVFGVSVAELALDPTNPSTLYAIALILPGGGVFKSTDAGAHWAEINNGLPSRNVLALALGPTNPSTLYVGIVGDGVFKSIDMGANWAAISNGLPEDIAVFALAIDPTNPSTEVTPLLWTVYGFRIKPHLSASIHS